MSADLTPGETLSTHLVEVSLGEFSIVKELVLAKLEVELETRLTLLEVRQRDVLQLLQDLLMSSILTFKQGKA